MDYGSRPVGSYSRMILDQHKTRLLSQRCGTHVVPKKGEEKKRKNWGQVALCVCMYYIVYIISSRTLLANPFQGLAQQVRLGRIDPLCREIDGEIGVQVMH